MVKQVGLIARRQEGLHGGNSSGASNREIVEEQADKETVIRDISDGNIPIRCAWSPPIPPKAGTGRD